MTEEEKIIAAKGIVSGLLTQKFHDQLEFDVDVVREFDDAGPGDGSPYLHVQVVVDGDFNLLLSKERWTSEFVTDMGDTFAQNGIEDEPCPVTSFFSKDE